MRRVNPKVFLIGKTEVVYPGISDYLDHIGAMTYIPPINVSGAECLTEVYGKLCYRSFEPGMNANVGTVTNDNAKYIQNIIGQRHGSVLEHSTLNFIIADVSRVFTHELVRHRVGVAYSQESLRYVRLTDLGLWLPKEIEDASPGLKEVFERYFKTAEELQLELANQLQLDSFIGRDGFKVKKKMTSLMRRLAPEGLSTTIGFTSNHRTLRHLMELRTAEAAEDEIREVFLQIGKICKDECPAIYADFTLKDGSWVTEYSKV